MADKKVSQKKNKEYWEEKAQSNAGHFASWWDVNMKTIEIENISSLLNKNDYVLDIGCSNGASTVEIAKNTGCKIHGVDNCKTAINFASEHYTSKKLSFEYADILCMKSEPVFDKIYSIRCIINLMSFEKQQAAIINIWKALKPGGTYIMCEAFVQGFKNMNRIREIFNLPDLEIPEYNNYLEENEIDKFLSKYFEIVNIKKYSSIYYLGTRVFQYLINDGKCNGTDTAIHKFFKKYNNENSYSGDFSPQKLYILKKK